MTLKREDLVSERDEYGYLADATAPTFGTINNPYGEARDTLDALLARWPEGWVLVKEDRE